jgi:Methyltransferase domain
MSSPRDEASHNSVRPTDKTPRRLLASTLAFMRHVAGGDRFGHLYGAVANAIGDIPDLKNHPIHLLDYGCGVMHFSKQLQRNGIVHSFIGMDIYTPSEAQTASDSALWAHYRTLPKAGIQAMAETFDIALVNDVLHHANADARATILADLATKCRYVLVKDHFEYGFFSRHLLRLADWYGNYAYGVNVPDRYFDVKSWQTLVAQAGLKEISLTRNVRVHSGLFGIILPPRHHFLSLLVR